MRLVPAAYRLNVSLRNSSGQGWISLPATGRVSVTSGRHIDRVFELRSNELRVRILGPGGEPRAGLQPTLRAPDESWETTLPATDADGWTRIDAAPAGPHIVTVLPKHLLDREAQAQFFQSNQGDAHAWRRIMVQLGDVDVVVGEEPTEAVFEVPPGAEY